MIIYCLSYIYKEKEDWEILFLPFPSSPSFQTPFSHRSMGDHLPSCPRAPITFQTPRSIHSRLGCVLGQCLLSKTTTAAKVVDKANDKSEVVEARAITV